MMSDDDEHWAKRAFDRHDETFDRLNAAAIDSGNLAIRAALLLNGGACIALLGFLASVFPPDDLADDYSRLVDQVIDSLGWFAWGAFAAVFAAGAGYFVNRCFVEARSNDTKEWDHPYIVKTAASRRWDLGGVLLTFAAIGGVIVSLVLFAKGLASIQGLF